MLRDYDNEEELQKSNFDGTANVAECLCLTVAPAIMELLVLTD